ncbi:MAG TPA: GH3 auxin-responsive promoter family protein [Acetobacteraceae bacterium]|nr:GH3 auxin-responsive promoter family protein [Acetobacteraceae bacterium]
MIDATPALRAYARRRHRRLAAEDAVAEQQRQLLRIVRAARRTEFGRAHGFEQIDSVAAFQTRVRLRRYEEFWREWWRPAFPLLKDVSWPGTIPYFAATSGTTAGTTKYIPVSRAMLAANGRAALDVLAHHVAAHPDSRVLAGRSLVLGGSTDLVRQAPGIYSGDLSGIAANEVPWWARSRYFPPRELALISDWQRKIDCLAPVSLQADIRTLSGTPSWVLAFFAKLAALRPDRPARSTSWYPDLELFVHGGVNFSPYRPQFEAIFAGSRVDMREVYPASEGFIAIADRGYGEGLRLLADNGLFFEFVPVEDIDVGWPTRHWLATAQCGVNYAVVLSSNAGLFAYVLGDTVRFVSLRPPRVLITGRLSYTLSAFGEHLIAEELEAAIQKAARHIARHVTEYTVAPVFAAQPHEQGGHSFVVEFTTPVDDATLARFGKALDQALADENADYRDHRTGMRAPEVAAVSPGGFALWMRQRGLEGGQHKVPRVIADPALFAALRDFLRAQGLIQARASSQAVSTGITET